ncbi:endoribonuclease SymE [Erwinia sp. AnSW2-5]|uniref:endoribonuclease SymE n=1 Tax=Erwinia sp. AnSW2-5 TaxID=3367692 RepID=UPI003859184F
MAEQHHKSEAGTPTTTRAYTVSYIRDPRTFERVPAITLKGAWLKEAGFDTGTPLNVRVLPGCLILSAQEPRPEPEEPEVVTTLRQTCKKLSARKQQQIAEFIQVIAGPQKRAAKV